MKKQKIQLLILAVVCLLCVGAYFGARYLGTAEENEETETFTATDFSVSDVIELIVSGDYPLNFTKDNDVWKDAQDRNASISQSMVESLLTQIHHVTSDTCIENPEDLGQYGLDEPSMTITVTLKNGSSIILNIGDANGMTGDYYLQVEGNTSVYTLSPSVVSAFEKTPEDFIEETETESETDSEPVTESAIETDSSLETETFTETDSSLETGTSTETGGTLDAETSAETGSGVVEETGEQAQTGA